MSPTTETQWSALRYNLLLVYLIIAPFDTIIPRVVNLVVLMLAALLIPVVLGRESYVKLSPIHLTIVSFLVILLVLSIVGIVAADRPILHLVRTRTSILYLIVVSTAVLEVCSVGRIRRLLAALALTAAGISLLSVLNLLVGVPFSHYIGPTRSLGPIHFFTPRTLGVEMAFGDFGTMVVIGGAFAWITLRKPDHFYTRGTKFARIGAAITLILLCVGVGLGQSRANILAVLATVGSLVFLRAARSRLTMTLTVVVLSGMLALLITVLNLDALATSFQSSQNPNIASRIHQYQFAFELIISNPLVGAGWGQFKLLFGEGINVHNLWLLYGAALGVPGLLLSMLLFGYLGLRSLRVAVSNRITLFSAVAFPGLVGFMVQAMFYPGFTDVGAITFGLLTAIVGFQIDECDQSVQESENKIAMTGERRWASKLIRFNTDQEE